MTKLVAYKKGTVETTESAGGSTQRIDFKAPDQEVIPWQWVAYQIEDITPDIIASLQRLFKNKAEEHEMVANVCSELANLSTMLKGPELKIVLQNALLGIPY